MQPEQPIQPIYSLPPTPNNPGGFTLKQKRIMLITGILVAVFAFLMIFTAIFGGKQSATEVSLTSVTARNSEIIRLINKLESELKTTEGKAYATQAKILLTSDNLVIIDYTLGTFSSTHTAQQVANTEITSTISALSDRQNQNDFDQVFIDSIRFELKLNKALLEQINSEMSPESLVSMTSVAIANYSSLL